MNKKILGLITSLVIVIAVLSIALAETSIQIIEIESNHIYGNVELPNLFLGINQYAGNNTTYQMGVNDTVQLTAILCDCTCSYRLYMPNVTVTFYNNGFVIGTALTDSTGNATIIYTIPPCGFEIYATAQLVESNTVWGSVNPETTSITDGHPLPNPNMTSTIFSKLDGSYLCWDFQTVPDRRLGIIAISYGRGNKTQVTVTGFIPQRVDLTFFNGTNIAYTSYYPALSYWTDPEIVTGTPG